VNCRHKRAVVAPLQLHTNTQAPTIGLRGTATATDAISASELFTLCDRLVLISNIYHLILLLTGKRKNAKHDQKEDATFFTLFVPTIGIITISKDIGWVSQNTTLHYGVRCHRVDDMFRPFTIRPSSGLTW